MVISLEKDKRRISHLSSDSHTQRRERSVTVPENNCYHFGIPEIIRQFKTFSSKRINEYLKRNGYEPFPTGALWQKSYYEHIIRDENDYITRVEYIINNPLKWEFERDDGLW